MAPKLRSARAALLCRGRCQGDGRLAMCAFSVSSRGPTGHDRGLKSEH